MSIDKLPDDIVATYDVTRQEREDLLTALGEGVVSYERLVRSCGDIADLINHKNAWSAQADRLRTLMQKLR